MTYAARIQDGRVAEVVSLPDGLALADAFHPDAGFVAADGSTTVGMTYAGGKFGAAPMAAADIPATKARMLAAVDAEAERQRLRWITPGSGQALTYQRKVEEASRLDADDGDVDAADYPMLSACLGIDGDTLRAVADVIIARDAMWTTLGASIEARRLGLKRSIAQAADAAALSQIDIEVGWPEAGQ